MHALTRTLPLGTSSYALSFLATGRTHDTDCSRSSTRLALAMEILRDVHGTEPVREHSARMVPSTSWLRPEGVHACGYDAATRTECRTLWTAPVSDVDLVAAWDLACEEVPRRAALARAGR